MTRLWRRLKFILNVRQFIPFLLEYFTSPLVPFSTKLISILFVVGYFLFPFDVIPDFLIAIGLVDDLAVLTFILQQIVKMAPESLRIKYGFPDDRGRKHVN